jgi:hypothetical protein
VLWGAMMGGVWRMLCGAAEPATTGPSQFLVDDLHRWRCCAMASGISRLDAVCYEDVSDRGVPAQAHISAGNFREFSQFRALLSRPGAGWRLRGGRIGTTLAHTAPAAAAAAHSRRGW